MENYQPYYVESISKCDDENKEYILDLSSNSLIANENQYLELHIKTINSKLYCNELLHTYIHLEIIDSNTVEIYEGEYYEESSTVGPITFEYLIFKNFEIDGQNDWKYKYQGLKNKLDKEIKDVKLDYQFARDKVALNFRTIYSKSLSEAHKFNLKREDLTEPYLFSSLCNLFNFNPVEDGIYKIISPNYYANKQIKSWKVAYENEEIKLNNLKETDFKNYSVIREHIIDIYKRTYEYMISNLIVNFKNINRNGYDAFFIYLIMQLEKQNKTAHNRKQDKLPNFQ